jgi:hypothetical protein
VLLEALVALTVAVCVGATAVPLITRAVYAFSTAEALDAEREAAERYLSALTVWTRAEVEARLGVRSNGPWDTTLTLEDDGTVAVTIQSRERPALTLSTRMTAATVQP